MQMARPVLRAFRDISRTAPEELTMWAHLLQFPPIPEVPEPLRGGSFVSVDIAFLGSAEDAEKHLMPLRTIPAQWFDTTDTVPISALGSICAEPVDPMPAVETSGLMRDFDNAAIDALIAAAGPDSGSPLVVVQVRHLGGALARGTDEQGPSGAGARAVPAVLPRAAHVAGDVGRHRADLRGGERRPGGLPHRPDLLHLPRQRRGPTRAFSPAALERLQQIKRRRDPRGIMRSNRPVVRD